MSPKNIQAIRGMNDILPSQTSYWHFLEDTLRHVLHCYGYQEIRTPLLEKTELFCRSIGEVTDIVEKEMYTFLDRNEESITLRPENTASCARAGIQHSLFNQQQVQRLWYNGAMFRYERPQKGRYRQFHQIGAELYGLSTPDADAELLLMSARFWRELGLGAVELQINSLGSNAARQSYRNELVEYFCDNQAQLDEDSQRRLETNPLRILDSKNPEMQALIEAAPRLLDHLDIESQQHFSELQTFLMAANVDFVINPRLVRGLDYYNRTVFEWVTTELGAQGTICAGGRYDNLVEQIGGKATPAVGFAMGVERLVALLEQANLSQTDTQPDAYLVMSGRGVATKGIQFAEKLRDALPTLKLVTHCGGGSFKSQFKKADKSGAQIALVIGEEEAMNGQVVLKYLRETREQEILAQSALPNVLQTLLK